jgi:hypothetical protein
MPGCGFGRCDGHHEMIDFRLRKQPHLGRALVGICNKRKQRVSFGAAVLWRARDRPKAS